MKRLLSLLQAAWLLAAMLVLLPAGAGAQTLPDWSVANPSADGAMLALDRADNAYVAGGMSGAMLLTKLAPSGAVLWQRSFEQAGMRSRSSWVSVDAAGNAIVAGMLVDASNVPAGVVVLKVDPAGTLLWQDVIASASDHAVRAEADAAGNVYLLARLSRPDPVLGGTLVEMALARYSPAGVRQWLRSFFGTNATVPDSIAVTPAGHVIAAGHQNGQILLAAFDAVGNMVWAKTVQADSGPVDLVPASGGAFYVIGGTRSATTAAPTGGFLVIRHDAAYNELWRNTYPARGSARRGAVDSTGNLVVVGATDTNTGLLTVVANDWLTLKLDPNGAVLWSRIDAANGADTPNAIALGADDALYVTGAGSAGVKDPSDPLGTYVLQSTLTVKLAPNGVQLWSANAAATSIRVFSSLQGVGVKASADGGVFVLAQLPQTLNRYPQNGLPNQPPTAIASASPSAGLAPLAVALSSAGSADPDGAIASHAWDFGDGQTSAAANPSHTYAAAGRYTASLTVTDSLGASARSAPVVITVNPSAPPPQPVSLVPASASVAGGTSTTATVTVSGSAGVTLALASSDPGVAKVPATVVVPIGATRVSFKITTAPVRRSVTLSLRASANGATVTAPLTVTRR